MSTAQKNGSLSRGEVLPHGGSRAAAPDKPSSFYRTELWHLGLWLVRTLPRPLSAWLGRTAGATYWMLHRERREVVVANLLPAVAGDRALAQRVGRRLMRQFALKMADLWRLEGGDPADDWLVTWSGWEHFQTAQTRGRGVLLITPHLGNWELGGPLLAKRGVSLLVITQAEPDSTLTELRKTSRARWGIQTVVVGQDAFAFIEVIRRLQEGASVAMLIDRPPAPGAVTVQLFGQPFQASIAAAEMARASGCALLGVYVPRLESGYAAHILPEFQYDRRGLGSREARQQLTQTIMSAFEGIIRQHLDQWYHFVPVWNQAIVPHTSTNAKV